MKISPNAQHVLHRLVKDRDDLVHDGRWSLVSLVGIVNPDGTTVPEDETVGTAEVMELVAAGLIATETKIAFVPTELGRRLAAESLKPTK